jgi:GTP-binding protein Era
LEVFKATVLRVLPEGHSLYDPKMLTDQTERMLVGEYVREQLLRFCRQEVPHRSAVVVDYFDEGERGTTGRELVRIGATIFVEKQSQRAIVIGKRGQMLKVIGSEARRQIERLLDAHVYLELRVAVEAGWSERVSGLVKMGYG